MSQYHFTPETYGQLIADDLPAYARLQDEIATHTRGGEVREFLDLGIGTGATTKAVLAIHPQAAVVGVDDSREMLGAAITRLGSARTTLFERRLQDRLPGGAYSLVVSALAIHHLDAAAKADLFRRVFGALCPHGRFVFGDVVVPERAASTPTPLSPDFDRPSSVADQLLWLKDAGFEAECVWTEDDLAVFSSTAIGPGHPSVTI